jgi:hypothetical protein
MSRVERSEMLKAAARFKRAKNSRYSDEEDSEFYPSPRTKSPPKVSPSKSKQKEKVDP